VPNDEPHKQSAKQSDEAAFAEFVAARTMALSRSAFLLTGDHHLAEDLVQVALFQTARSWSRIRSNPEAYARRILYNENISWWRRRRHLRESQLFGSTEPVSRGGDTDLRMTLEQALPN
jgi:DNA-directed RNA polymerase specialized sigma24 family protein